MFLISISSLFFVCSWIYIYRKSFIFAFAYLLLFAYTIFTQFGYLLYPEKLSSVSHGQYYGETIFGIYWLYVFLSFIFIFLIFTILYRKSYKLPIRIRVSSSSKSTNICTLLYILVILLYEAVLCFFLTKNYMDLSYYNQYILKSNKFWFYLFSLNGIILLSLFCKLRIVRNKLAKIFYLITFFISLSIFLVTSIRSGQRIEGAEAILAFAAFLWSFSIIDKSKTKGRKLKYIFATILICFIVVGFFQGIRVTRGHHETIGNFFTVLKSGSTYLSLLSFEKNSFPGLSESFSNTYDFYKV